MIENKNRSQIMKELWKNEDYKKHMSEAHKGQKPNLGNFKKGLTPWNKGIEFLQVAGEKNINWKGGITPLNKKLRAGALHRIWKEAVFLRDNFICQNPNCKFCNNKEGVLLNTHHIKPVALYPELAFKIENGITYCEGFHIRSKTLHKNITKRRIDR